MNLKYLGKNQFVYLHLVSLPYISQISKDIMVEVSWTEIKIRSSSRLKKCFLFYIVSYNLVKDESVRENVLICTSVLNFLLSVSFSVLHS